MLIAGDIPYGASIRSAGLGNIPILSDAQDTYISQNQNALTVGLLADAGAIAGGLGLAVGSGGVGAGLGGGAVIGGITSIASKVSGVLDAGAHATNPTTFLGSALMNCYNGMFWIVTSKRYVDNADNVHSRFGYPYNSIRELYFPSSGFISTEGCCVSSDGTVPAWAIDEINSMFDKGVLVH